MESNDEYRTRRIKKMKEHMEVCREFMRTDKAGIGEEQFVTCVRAYFPGAPIHYNIYSVPYGKAQHLLLRNPDTPHEGIMILNYYESGPLFEFNVLPWVIDSEKNLLETLKKLNAVGWKAE